MATVILTVIGDDRPGLVSDLAAPINTHGADWERSQMARLAGKFAGILVVDVAPDHADALVDDLMALNDQGLHVVVERASESAERELLRFHLDLLGADHPGIVAEISAALSKRGISIDELSTNVREAPMAGGMLFEAHAVLDAPPNTSSGELHTVLEGLANTLMVDITLSEG